MSCISVTITPLLDDSALTYLYSSDEYQLLSSDDYLLATGSAGGGITVTITEVCSVS